MGHAPARSAFSPIVLIDRAEDNIDHVERSRIDCDRCLEPAHGPSRIPISDRLAKARFRSTPGSCGQQPVRPRSLGSPFTSKARSSPETMADPVSSKRGLLMIAESRCHTGRVRYPPVIPPLSTTRSRSCSVGKHGFCDMIDVAAADQCQSFIQSALNVRS